MDLKHALQIIVESLRLTRIALGRVRACRDFGAEAGDDYLQSVLEIHLELAPTNSGMQEHQAA